MGSGESRSGKKDGKWTWSDENGQITPEKIYKDGVCISGLLTNQFYQKYVLYKLIQR